MKQILIYLVVKVPTIIAMTVFPVADGITALTVAMSLYNSSPKIIGGR